MTPSTLHPADRPLPDEPEWPERAGQRPVFLLDASSDLEKRILEGWIRRHQPAGMDRSEWEAVAIPPTRRPVRRRGTLGGLEAVLVAPVGDPLLVPLRVAWDREKVEGRRENPLRELLTIGDPRDPGRLRQEWVLRRAPQLCRIVLGKPAHLSELRERWRSACSGDAGQTIGLAEFISRQATLALERAERGLRGARYKVPRLVREDILSRPSFRAGVARLARESGEPEATVARRAEAYLKEIAATHDPHVIDLSAHLIHSLYTQGYGESLEYDRARLERIFALGQRHPVVFLPSHKSNLDHLVLQYALHENGHPPNHTAGGINMNFFPVGPLVRRSGVFFIRRTFKDNPVYKFVLRQYVDYLVEKRFTLEWYVEGGRSRSGKLLPPRLGLLAYVADAYRRGLAEDVILVPVSIAYDQIQDVGDYVAEQRGGKKRKESFGWFVHVVRSLRRRLGRIHINFGDPVSLREALGPPGAGHEADPDEEAIHVQKLAFEVAHRINRVTPVTPTSLLTLALLGAGQRGVTMAEIERSTGSLVDYVERRGLPVTEAPSVLRTRDGIERTIEGLIENGVVTCFREALEPVYAIVPEQCLTAAYYRNTIIHFFVNASIVELALLGAGEDGAANPRDAFFDEALRLRDLLKFDFFFAPKDEFRREIALEIAVREPEGEAILRSGPAEIRAAALRLRPLLSHRVLRPFFEGYRVVAERLVAEPVGAAFDEAAFLSSCVALGRQYELQRRISSPESVSKVVFQNGLALARNKGLVAPSTAAPERIEEARRRFAAEMDGVMRRIEVIESIGQARRAGILD
jgi:glycerol-3-phosphate O-acyltransferase